MAEAQLGRFGDQRLAATGNDLLGAMQKHQTMCLHVLGESRDQTRRFSDFLDNEAVSRREMLAHAGQLTGQRAAGRHALAVMDTTELNFAGHTASKRGFGTVGNGKDIGVLVHPVIAVDADHGGILGLVSAAVINRDPGRAEDHKQRPADDKESRRWLAGMEVAEDLLARAATITAVEDREGDIYDQFASSSQCASAGPRRAGPFGGIWPQAVPDLRHVVGGRAVYHHGAGPAGRVRARGREPSAPLWSRCGSAKSL